MQAQHIADQLKSALLRGEFAPGAKLKQEVLASRFGASRIPVRDAFALLAQMGLITLVPNKGAHVISMSRRDLQEAFDLRVMLETDALRRAVGNFSQSQLTHLEQVQKHSDIDAHGPNWAEGDRTFHAALYAPSGRPRQIAIIDQLRIACQIQIAAYGALPSRTEDWLEDHRLMVEAVAAGGSETAVTHLERHLRAAEAHLLDVMPPDA